MTTDSIQEIEMGIEEAREYIERGEALERLYRNPDFQNIVVKGYFEREAVRLVHLKGDPAMRAPEHQAAIIQDMDGIAALHSHFRVILMQAQQMREAIQDGEEALEEIRDSGEGE